MSDYTLLQRGKNGILRTRHWKYGDQIWTLGRLTYRKWFTSCALCGQQVGGISYKAYRPVSNQKNRGERICSDH